MNSNGPDVIHTGPPDNLNSPLGHGAATPDQKDEIRYAFLPRTLQGKFPQLWLLVLEKNNRTIVEVTLFALAFLTLFATIIGQPHQTEWPSLLTAVLAPIAFAVWYVLFPLNPYQTVLFTRQGLQNLDQNDSAAHELVSILSSPEAGRFLWQRAQRLWILFLAPMVVVVLALHKLPALEATPSWLVRVPIFCLLLFAIFRIEMLAWALRVMKRSE
jgi:hypothetical protein